MHKELTVVKTVAILPCREDQMSLSEVFRHSHWSLYVLSTVRDVRGAMSELNPGVVISDSLLPDGTWKDVLQGMSEIQAPPPLIVASRMAEDRLWAEVLNLGGYDVLNMPFDAEEVMPAVSLAWRHWRDQRWLSRGVGPAMGNGLPRQQWATAG